MSLKAFHVVFITASSAMAFGCAVWAVRDYFAGDRSAIDLVFAGASLAAAVGLILYERYFLKKLKDVSYL